MTTLLVSIVIATHIVTIIYFIYVTQRIENRLSTINSDIQTKAEVLEGIMDVCEETEVIRYKLDKLRESVEEQAIKGDKRTKDFEKAIKSFNHSAVRFESTCHKIAEFTEKHLDEVSSRCLKETVKVMDQVKAIARDFHVLGAKLTDGTIKEIKILSEDQYLDRRRPNGRKN